jgi:hypothetical protein
MYNFSTMVKTLFIVMLCMAMHCSNPPESRTIGQRSDPQGLIDQLIESYETRNIDLFIDLFPHDNSFRFYISPDFYEEFRTKYQPLSEVRDTRLLFIGQSEYYYYWTQDVEIEQHRQLFSHAHSIEFTSKPAIESVRKFIDNGDSVAELRVTGGFLEVGTSTNDTVDIYPVAIEQQIFLIIKDTLNSWVIRKWYDFSSEP